MTRRIPYPTSEPWPARVQTNNGQIWVRRINTRRGCALYAPEHLGPCSPEYMKTLPELRAQYTSVEET